MDQILGAVNFENHHLTNDFPTNSENQKNLSHEPLVFEPWWRTLTFPQISRLIYDRAD
jgi:hypothetical protein